MRPPFKGTIVFDRAFLGFLFEFPGDQNLGFLLKQLAFCQHALAAYLARISRTLIFRSFPKLGVSLEGVPVMRTIIFLGGV